MSNETCPPPPIGQNGQQVDLNGATTSVESGVFIQRHNLEAVEDLCRFGMSPSLTTGVIMQIVANHFSDPTLIMTESLKQYTWSKDPATNHIRVVQNTRFDPVQAGLLPAVICARGALQSDRRAMGDRIDTIDLTDADDGIQTYARFITGSSKLFCVAEADGEAEDLALEVFDTLTFLAPMIERYLPFHVFEVVGLGELGVLEGLGNKIGVPVEVRYTYEYAWKIQPIAPRLKTVNLQVT